MTESHCPICEGPLSQGRVTCSRLCANTWAARQRWKDHDPTQQPDYQRADGYWVTWRTGEKDLLHRAVMAEHLGRPLAPGEVVHHIDHNPDNNTIENLRLKASQAEHMGEHGRPCGDDCTCGRHQFRVRQRAANGTFLPTERTAS